MKKKSFLYGAIILSVSALISKILGALYRIPLTNLLGTEGVGIYQMIFPVYALFLVISSSGIPVAISRLVSSEVALGREKNVKKILRTSVVLMLIIGTVCSLIVFFLGSFIADLQGNALAKVGYLAVAPSILVASMVTVFRGYFEGLQNMKPTALSEVLEQVTKVVVGLTFAGLLLPRGTQYGVLGAVLGITVSEVVCLITIVFFYFLSRRKNKITLVAKNRAQTANKINEVDDGEEFKIDVENSSGIKLGKFIFKQSLPITLGAIIIPTTIFIDSVLIINLLVKSGFNLSTATSLFGIQTGVVNSLINVPMIIAFGLATAILPSLSASKALKHSGEIDEKSTLAIKIVWLVALPCFIEFLLLAPDITSLLYGGGLNSGQISEVFVASSLLRIAAVTIIYTSMLRIFISVLHALNRSFQAVRNLVIASLVKVILTIALVSITSINIYGASLASAVSYGIACMLNLYSVKKVTNLKLNFKQFIIAPLIACATLIMAIFAVKLITDALAVGEFATLIQIIMGGLFYFIALILLKVFTKEELNYLPSLKRLKKKVLNK